MTNSHLKKANVLASKKSTPKTSKPKLAPVLHPRNLHQGRYDLEALMNASIELKAFVKPNAYGDLSVDFHNPLAVIALNRALLAHHYGIQAWNLPEDYLCPPIPGRADYIHYLADLLAQDMPKNHKPEGSHLRVLDLGTGASAIYALLGHTLYGWDFVGSEIDALAVDNANEIIKHNPQLQNHIEIRLQANRAQRLWGVIEKKERFAACLCNPPFHASAKEAAAGSKRKVQNLKGKQIGKASLNFGGQSNELWCEGGEVAFVGQLIDESPKFARKCVWFTSLVSKKESLPALYQKLHAVNAVKVKTIDMQQGQKSSRILAWTFLDKMERAAFFQELV